VNNYYISTSRTSTDWQNFNITNFSNRCQGLRYNRETDWSHYNGSYKVIRGDGLIMLSFLFFVVTAWIRRQQQKCRYSMNFQKYGRTWNMQMIWHCCLNLSTMYKRKLNARRLLRR